MVDDGVGEGDALRGRLWAVLDVRYPAVLFCEEGVAGEQRRGVAVGTGSEEDEVEDGEASGVLLRKLADKLLFVRVRELLEVVGKRGVDRVDVVCRDRDLGEELIRAEPVVGIGVVERDYTLVGVEHLPERAR